MASITQAGTLSPADLVRQSPVSQAANGICFASFGETAVSAPDLERMVMAVPSSIAAALTRKAFYFVPLTVNEGEQTVIAERYDVAMSDRAVCHRNLTLGDSQCVFISTRLMDDKFSVAFEFYINVGHAFVERAGVSAEFSDLVWRQVEQGARGETSLDAHDFRRQAIAKGENNSLRVIDERAKTEFLRVAFSDAVAIYLLSLCLDVDYYDLREREYPLLAPPALAERLRKIAQMFPPNPGFEFNVYYRRRA